MSGEIEWECENCGTRLHADDPRACPECGDPLLTPVELDVVDEGDGESLTERFDVDQAMARLEELKDTPARRRQSSETAASRSTSGRSSPTTSSSGRSASGRSSSGRSSSGGSSKSSSLAQFVAMVFGLLVVLLAVYIVVQAGLVP